MRALVAAPIDRSVLGNSLGAARAQVHENYIVAQTHDSLVIVDQHAAHERLVYEALKQALASRSVPAQMLLLPEIVDLPEDDADRLARHADVLRRFGLGLERFGPGAVAVRETPSMLGETDVQALVRDLADEIAESDTTDTLQSRSCMQSPLHGLPRFRPVWTAAQARGDECAAATDGSHARFRHVQPWTPDLCGTQARRHRATVRKAVRRDRLDASLT
jgi:DNA mismatch repair ATPase MutL